MKEKKAYTLVELIVATSILSMSVFWIYKLISENIKNINNSNQVLSSYSLFPIIENCIENLDLEEIKYIYIWEDFKKCENFNESKINIINNTNYILKATKKDNNLWETEVSSENIKTLTGAYIKKNRD